MQAAASFPRHGKNRLKFSASRSMVLDEVMAKFLEGGQVRGRIGMELRQGCSTSSDQKKLPVTYREWLNETNRNLNRCWCLFNAAGLFLDSFVYHPPVTLVSLLHFLVFLSTSLALFWRPQAAEVCFVLNNCCRIVLTLLVGMSIIPLTPSFERHQELHLEKIYEIGLLSVFEQIRLSWMIPIRLALTVGYFLCYARYKHPFPAFTALLVNACATGIYLWVDRYRYKILYARYLRVSIPDQDGRPAPAATTTAKQMRLQPQVQMLSQSQPNATTAKQRQLPPQVQMLSQSQTEASHEVDAAGAFAPQHLQAPQVDGADALHQPRCTQEQQGIPRMRPEQQGNPRTESEQQGTPRMRSELQQRCGSELQQDDSYTQRKLEYVRRCLNSKRVRYTSHLKHSKVSMKIPCSSGPSCLAGMDVRAELDSLVHARNSEAEIVSAVMRAGCIILVADVRSPVGALPCSHPGSSTSMQASPACAQELGRDMVHAAMTWLAATHLPGELHTSTPVALQVDEDVYLCQLSSAEQATWDVQGPLKASSTLLHQGCKILPASSSALLTPISPCENSPGAAAHSEGEHLTVRARVLLPSGAQVLLGTNTSSSPLTHTGRPEANLGAQDGASAAATVAAAADVGFAAADGAAHGKSGESGAKQLRCRIMACTTTCYVPLQLVPISSTASAHAAGSWEMHEVDLLLPLKHLTPHHHPHLLRLELWAETELLLGHSSMLLLPHTTQHAVRLHEELQGLPWGQEGCEDVGDFVVDVGHWLQRCHARGSALPAGSEGSSTTTGSRTSRMRISSASGTVVLEGEQQDRQLQQLEPQQQQHEQQQEAQQQQGRVAGATLASARSSGTPDTGVTCPEWRTGRSLLRQALLWALPELATLLLEHLVSLPTAPPRPLAHLLSTPASAEVVAHRQPPGAAAAGTSAAEQGGGCGSEGKSGDQVEQERALNGQRVAAHGDANEQGGEGDIEGSGGGGGSGEEEDEQGMDIEGLGGLLHLALLSPAPAAMLECVLGWGRRFWSGEEREGWVSASASAWQQRNAAHAATPLDLLSAVGIDIAHTVQSGDPCTGPAPAAAAAVALEQAAQTCYKDAEEVGLQQSNGASLTLPSSLPHSLALQPSAAQPPGFDPCGKDPAAPSRSCAVLRGLLSSCAHARLQCVRHALRVVACVRGSQPAFAAVECGQWPAARAAAGGAVPVGMDEGEYRAWASAQWMPILRAWSWCYLVLLSYHILQGFAAGKLKEETPTLLIGLAPYLLIILTAAPHRMLGHVLLLFFSRIVRCAGIGLGILPFPTAYAVVTRFQYIEFIVITFFGIVERAPIPWLLPCFFLQIMGTFPFYRKLGVAKPLLQAVMLTGCSMTSSLAMDMVNRRTYCKRAFHIAATSTSAGAQASTDQCPEARKDKKNE